MQKKLWCCATVKITAILGGYFVHVNYNAQVCGLGLENAGEAALPGAVHPADNGIYLHLYASRSVSSA